MWPRNLLFVVICLASSGLVVSTLFDRNESPPNTKSAEPTPADDRTAVLDQLNAEFRQDWQARQLEPAPRADDLAIARRLSLALLGTVPSLEELRAFEALPASGRIEVWLDRLLADRRFSDYWAERLARVYVGNDQGPFIVFRRRRFTLWLSDQLHENRSYDAIVRDLLSEEGIWTAKPATNFVTATSNPTMDNQPDPVRLAGRTARAFLGMRIDCLQCHDDKLGTILVGSPENIHSGTQATFHQLAAFFGPTEVTLVGVHDENRPYKTKYLGASSESVVPPKVPFGEDSFSGHGTRREQLAHWVTHPQNKPFARATVNRVWALLFGKPLLEPIDDLPLAGVYPPGLQRLADDFTAHNYDLQRLIRLIALSDPFHRDSRADFHLTEQHENAWAAFPLTRLRPEQISGSVIQAASLKTINGDAHIVWRLIKSGQTQQFVRRYGDLGEDEFTARGSTIPQRLLMMNGNLVKERTQNNPLLSASTRIAMLSADPAKQIEAAYLATLTRRPTAEELAHFTPRLHDRSNQNRAPALEDLYWTFINSTEFSWNH